MGSAPTPASSSPSAAPSRWRWIYPAALAAVQLLASSQSEVGVPSGFSLDKVGHFAFYGLLATLIARTQPPSRWWWAVVIASLFGVVDELWQSQTPGRAMEVADWVADTAGAFCAVWLYARWPAYRAWLERPLGRRSRTRAR